MRPDDDEELLLATGFDDCILGICTRFGMEPVVAYDRAKVIDTLVQRDGMSYEDAEEFFAFNIIGAWVGQRTPVYIEPWTPHLDA